MSERRDDRPGARNGTVALAFLAGAVVGAVGALLLAPHSGAETRRQLGEAAGGAAERARRLRAAAAAAATAASKTLQAAMHEKKAD
ncbi:MAG: YtxH domain-containing protein [Myxococcales bacterium]